MHEITVSIFRRTGRKNYEMQYRDPFTGGKVRRTTGERIKSKALKVAGNWEKELRDGSYKAPDKALWAEFRERYEEEAVPGLKNTTDGKIAGVFNAVERILNPRRIGDIDRNALNRYVKGLRNETIKRGDQDVTRSESTIRSHLATLRAALQWAVDDGMLRAMPKFPKIQRAKRADSMKGRPITGEEFDRMLAAIPKAFTPKANKRNPNPQPPKNPAVVESWRFLLRGLWLSGLRLGEAFELHWTDDSKLCVDLSGHHPMLRIPAELEKGNRDRLLPMAPEFAEFLLAVPKHERRGYVFNPIVRRSDKPDRMLPRNASVIISRIGERAGVKVKTEENGVVKYASAHDLRRSFGERWSWRVMPQVLKELMRHESVETTMKFYVGRNAQATASILWEAHNSGLGATWGANGQNEPGHPNPRNDKTPDSSRVSERGADRIRTDA